MVVRGDCSTRGCERLEEGVPFLIHTEGCHGLRRPCHVASTGSAPTLSDCEVSGYKEQPGAPSRPPSLPTILLHGPRSPLYLRRCHPHSLPSPPGAPGPAHSRWSSRRRSGPGPRCSGLSAGSAVPSMPAGPGRQCGRAGHPGGPWAPAGRCRHQPSHPSWEHSKTGPTPPQVQTHGTGSMRLGGGLDKSRLCVAFREKGRGIGDGGQGRAPKGTVDGPNRRRTLGAGDAKWATSGPSKSSSPSPVPWGPGNQSQCGGPPPGMALQPGSSSPPLAFVPQTLRSSNESLSWAQQDPTAGKGGTRCLRCLGTALGHEATKGLSPEAPSSGVQGTAP